jgi:hypothetical protein
MKCFPSPGTSPAGRTFARKTTRVRANGGAASGPGRQNRWLRTALIQATNAAAHTVRWCHSMIASAPAVVITMRSSWSPGLSLGYCSSTAPIKNSVPTTWRAPAASRPSAVASTSLSALATK